MVYDNAHLLSYTILLKNQSLISIFYFFLRASANAVILYTEYRKYSCPSKSFHTKFLPSQIIYPCQLSSFGIDTEPGFMQTYRSAS